MNDLDERLKRLEVELEALRRVKTQDDYDEGARLHALHNAPWVKGQYSHLEFPPYQYRAFPKMVYGLGYQAAVAERDAAFLIPAFGMDDLEKKTALMLAERKIQASTKIVASEAEFRTLGSGWFASPDEVVAFEKSLQRDVEVAAAHRAYEDRNMSAKAKREIDAFDDAAETFVAEIPQTRKRPGRPRKQIAGGAHGKA